MDSATKILNIAECQMRQAGYNAVSYRDIAAEVGIKSASLHYHFPKKRDLGIALVRRYSERFHHALEAKTLGIERADDKIQAFIDIHAFELKEQRLVCLCAVLGAESPGLPTGVTIEIQRFFQSNINWLEAQYTALGSSNADHQAKVTLSLLEGAMIISSVNNDNSIFDAAARSIMQNIATP